VLDAARHQAGLISAESASKFATGFRRAQHTSKVFYNLQNLGILNFFLGEEGFGSAVTCRHCQQAKNTETERQCAKQKQQEQANRMLKILA